MSDEDSFDELAYLRNEVARLKKSLAMLTPRLEAILKKRGFRIYKKEPAENLLIPRPGAIDDYYRMMHKYSFRLFLRDVIKQQDHFSAEDVTRYATLEKTSEYISYLKKAGLIRKTRNAFSLVKQVKSFGPTLEWYIAEILKREFGAETVWGVKFKRPGIGGDYDVIAKLDGLILYAEVKSSPPKQIFENEISAFLDRVSDLSPDIAIFLMDTELRMKDKIVPMFEQELVKRPSQGLRPPLQRLVRELFHSDGRLFIVNAGGNILYNLETVIRHFFLKDLRGNDGLAK